MRHLPTFLSVEPANFCQLHCPECPVGMRSKQPPHTRQQMPLTHFQHILLQCQSTAHTIQFYFQGEPLLNHDLPKMIALAHQQRLYTILSTNAQALTSTMAEQLVESGLNRIIVSIDGFSEESYQAYRKGGSLQRALQALSFLSEAKKRNHSTIRIELQVLRLRTNEHEWKWIRRHYRSLGATHLVFKTAQLYDYRYGHPLMPTHETYSRYRRHTDGTYHLHRHRPLLLLLFAHRNREICYRLWSGCVINTAGDLLPCCYDKSSEYAFGNIQHTPLSEIWHSKTADKFRRQLLFQSHQIPMCQECNY